MIRFLRKNTRWIGTAHIKSTTKINITSFLFVLIRIISHSFASYRSCFFKYYPLSKTIHWSCCWIFKHLPIFQLKSCIHLWAATSFNLCFYVFIWLHFSLFLTLSKTSDSYYYYYWLTLQRYLLQPFIFYMNSMDGETLSILLYSLPFYNNINYTKFQLKISLLLSLVVLRSAYKSMKKIHFKKKIIFCGIIFFVLVHLSSSYKKCVAPAINFSNQITREPFDAESTRSPIDGHFPWMKIKFLEFFHFKKRCHCVYACFFIYLF